MTLILLSYLLFGLDTLKIWHHGLIYINPVKTHAFRTVELAIIIIDPYILHLSDYY
jgi:hypothetical protein